MEVIETNITGVRIIRLEPFRDMRGAFVELFNRDTFMKVGIDCNFSFSAVMICFSKPYR